MISLEWLCAQKITSLPHPLSDSLSFSLASSSFLLCPFAECMLCLVKSQLTEDWKLLFDSPPGNAELIWNVHICQLIKSNNRTSNYMHLGKWNQDVTLRGPMAAMTSVFTVASGWVFRPAIPKPFFPHKNSVVNFTQENIYMQGSNLNSALMLVSNKDI